MFSKNFKEKSQFILCAAICLLYSACANFPHSKEYSTTASGTSEFDFRGLEGARSRELLANCLHYAKPENALVDPISGYPCEGWNQEPEKGLFLRSFTQLTAIGVWIETLANIAAGNADNPFISREDALDRLSLAVKSLREDQQNPEISDRGLLVNFLSIEGGKRRAPLTDIVEKRKFIDLFGEKTASEIWSALIEIGWISPEDRGLVGRIRRSGNYGHGHFKGPLAPFTEEKTEAAIMKLLDSRAITVVFGDNVNLSASIARSIGALHNIPPSASEKAPGLAVEMEEILEHQRDGYLHLFDGKSGTFAFGWDASRERFLGWDDPAGNWVTGRMNYLVNEFRAPWIFAAARFGIPMSSFENAGFKMRPYRFQDGTRKYALCAWDGSAFQFFGFSIFMGELEDPAWKKCLEILLDVELDFSRKKSLPGFLSEGYSGNGSEYTGAMGIKELAISERPLLASSATSYPLGLAMQINQGKTEDFLNEFWPLISSSFTGHGPWEGYDTLNRKVIEFQTCTHTLSLLNAGILSANSNMKKYLEKKGLLASLSEFYKKGEGGNLLDKKSFIPLTWSADGSPAGLEESGKGSLKFSPSASAMSGLSFKVSGDKPLNVSGTHLTIAYENTLPQVTHVNLSFKRLNPRQDQSEFIPVEINLELEGESVCKDGILQIQMPASPALNGISEVSLTKPFTGKPPASSAIIIKKMIFE